MARSTWQARELPILEAIAAAEEADAAIDSDGLATATGLPETAVCRGLAALMDGEYISGDDVSSQTTPFALLDVRLRERGRRAVGQWPSEDPFDGLIAVLEARLAEETNTERKGKLGALLDAVRGVGRDVAVAVLTDLVKQHMGVP